MSSWPESETPPRHQAQLMPGGLSVTGPGWSLQTLVGSCVAVLVWDSQRPLAGMCHYVLAARARPRAGAGALETLDGRYGIEALRILDERMGLSPASDTPALAHVVGGAALITGSIMPTTAVGQANIELAMDWVRQKGLSLGQVLVGGDCGRRIEFNTSSGALSVTEVSAPALQQGQASALSGVQA